MTILIAGGFQGWRTVFNNFAVEVVNISGQQMGILQSVREIPGLLALLVVYLLFIIKEHKLAALSVLVFGIGAAVTGFLDTFHGMLFSVVLMSFGFHYYETVNQSLTLQYFSTASAPLIMAKLRSISAATNIAIGGIVFLLTKYFNYKEIFLLIGVVVCIGAIWCLLQNPASENIVPQHKKMIFRKKYWLFYVLTLFAGARRQIFIAFAVFLLVKKFGFSVQEITCLFVANNIIAYFTLPLMGKLINIIGERKVLSIEYLGLVFVFLTYAFTGSKIIAAFMYIIDHILFGFSIAIKSYFQKNADPADIAPSMAVGFTINHGIAVILPVLGGMLWMINYKIPFILGVVLSICSLVFVQMIKTPGVEQSVLLQEQAKTGV